eukprot:CAMPEP_0181486552 /NCGR_PEP_ID=MMETSP1110-20121109/47243_1 /TAXON_ID=174948 /ORGANISM="Symbiodinium sp., Strain CCMP421" /LENGTH=47 /DNA_ID= /DNA_START= /DNA_END= /DNA_ORIENTATION=
MAGICGADCVAPETGNAAMEPAQLNLATPAELRRAAAASEIGVAPQQ